MRLGRCIVAFVYESVEGFDGVALRSGLFAACQSPGEVLAAQWARLGGGGGCFWWCVDPSSVTDSVVASASVLFAMGVVLVHVVLLVVGGGSAGPWGPAVPPGGRVGCSPSSPHPCGVRIYSARRGPFRHGAAALQREFDHGDQPGAWCSGSSLKDRRPRPQLAQAASRRTRTPPPSSSS